MPDGTVAYDQRLTRLDTGEYVVRTDRSAMLVEVDGGRMTVRTDRDSMLLQLVTTYGIPLLLHSAPALVLHACSAVPPAGSGALVVCGPSGTGKSSLLAALVAAGWQALSEDASVVDLRAGPTVWPGPPWVRSVEAQLPGATERFRTPDKTAWDIAPHQTHDATPLSHIAFLERPGGASIEYEELPRGEVIGRLGRSAIWLTGAEGRAEATFGSCVAIAGAARGTRLRLPVTRDWVDRLVEAVGDLVSGR